MSTRMVSKSKAEILNNIQEENINSVNHEKFLTKIKVKFGEETLEEYTFLEPYIDSKTYIMVKHNVCDNVYPVKPNNFLTGYRCRKCSNIGREALTNEEFLENVRTKYGEDLFNEYTFLESYTSNTTPIKIRHNVCNYEKSIQPRSIMRDLKCSKCAGLAKKTTESFKQEVYDLVGDEYIVIGDYITNNKPIEMRHNSKECNYHEWSVSPNNFLNHNSRCRKCSGKMKKDTESFKQEVYDLVGEEFTVLGEYQRNDVKILMRHNICNHEWRVVPSAFLITGSRCPKCNESKGEKAIFDYLTKNNIIFDREYKFDDLKDDGPLRFDFAVMNKEEELIFLIEFQGIQHYDYNDYHYKKDYNFIDRLNKDNLKKVYCEYHKIPLLEIKYDEFNNIEAILEKEVEKYGLK